MGISGASKLVFTGTYHRSLDGKARVLLPKRVRTELSTSDRLFLTPGTDHCLELHTDFSLNSLASKANQSAAGSQNIKSFSRLFYAQAEQCDIDGQGRIRIPRSLVQYAGMEKEIYIVGVGFNWELWDFELWNQYLRRHEDEFDQVAQTTFDGVIHHQSAATPINPQTTSIKSELGRSMNPK